MKNDPTESSVEDALDIRSGVAMKIDVQTEGGTKIIQLIEALLAERMTIIAKSDPQCRGLLNVLENVGMNIKIAAEKSARLMVKEASGEGD